MKGGQGLTRASLTLIAVNLSHKIALFQLYFISLIQITCKLLQGKQVFY